MIARYPYPLIPKVKPKFLEGLYSIRNATENFRRWYDRNGLPYPVFDMIFQEGAGPTANDFSGLGHDGPWGGTGDHWAGRAGQFNGNDDGIAGISFDSIVNAFSVFAWTYSKSNATSPIIVELYGGATYTNSFDLHYANTNKLKINLYQEYSDNWKQFFSSDAISINTWHFVGFTWDGTDIRMYVDGAEISTDVGAANKAVTMGSQSRTLSVGIWEDSSANRFNGLIDGAMIFDETLIDSQISLLCRKSYDRMYPIDPQIWSFLSPAAPPAGSPPLVKSIMASPVGGGMQTMDGGMQ